MIGRSRTLFRRTLRDSASAISSAGFSAGRTLCNWRESLTTFRVGRHHFRASLSRSRAGRKAKRTLDTSGRPSGNSSKHAGLQCALGNKLLGLLDVNGSLEYEMIWTIWDIGSPVPIYRLHAWARPRSANGFSGWPTPMASDGAGPGKDDLPRIVQMVREVIRKGRRKGSGATTISLNAPTGKADALAPSLPLWLQGFPAEWLRCAELATLSIPSLRHCSFRRGYERLKKSGKIAP